MEAYLEENFSAPAKADSDEALKRWRSLVGLVKNPKRRFRFTANLSKRYEVEAMRRSNKEKLRVAVLVSQAALEFIQGAKDVRDIKQSYKPEEKVEQAGFLLDPDKLASLLHTRNNDHLRYFDGVEGIARNLSVSLDKGTSRTERPPISVRRELFGSNQYDNISRKNFLTFAWESMQDKTLEILIICSLLSMILGAKTKGWPEGMYDGVGILLCTLFVIVLTAIHDYKQHLKFQEFYEKGKEKLSHVLRDGNLEEVPISDLVVGDIVQIYAGDITSADGLFVEGYSLLIDESNLTGESDPVTIDKKNPFILSGSKVLDGSAKMLVTSVGMRTYWKTLIGPEAREYIETPLQVKLNGVATVVGMIGLFFSILIFVVLSTEFIANKILHNQFLEWSLSDAMKLLNDFTVAVTILVVAVPEGLPLAVVLSLAYSLKNLAKDGAIVRKLSACETMGSINCICIDKTGTLTTNHMTVNKVWISNRILSGKDVTVSTKFGKKLDILLESIFQNSSYDVLKGKDGKKIICGTPTDAALQNFGSLLGGDYNGQSREFRIVKVEPFSSSRKKMSTMVACSKGGFRVFVKGAPEIILNMCDHLTDFEGNSIYFSKELKKSTEIIVNEFCNETLRTLCLAFKDINETCEVNDFPNEGYTLVAVVGIHDPLRPEVNDAVKTCLAAGIAVRMVTGDNINTAKAIAKKCGILLDDGLAIEGSDFRTWSPHDRMKLLPKLQVLARAMPSDKHLLVTELKKVHGQIVAVTGDGINDAPALSEAHIGLAMGIGGTEVAREHADVVLADDNFAAVVSLIKWGRAINLNIQKFVQFQLTVNVVVLMFDFLSASIIGCTPLTVVQLLWINIIMDILGALALATEPPNDLIYEGYPTRRRKGIITGTMWLNIIGQSIFQLMVLLIMEIQGKSLLKLHGPDANSVLNTFIFNTLVFFQVANQINSRNLEKYNVFHGILKSHLFISVIIFTVVVQIIMLEFLGTFMNTVPLDWKLWLISVLFGLSGMGVSLLLKFASFIKLNSDVTGDDGYEQLPSGPNQA